MRGSVTTQEHPRESTHIFPLCPTLTLSLLLVPHCPPSSLPMLGKRVGCVNFSGPYMSTLPLLLPKLIPILLVVFVAKERLYSALCANKLYTITLHQRDRLLHVSFFTTMPDYVDLPGRIASGSAPKRSNRQWPTILPLHPTGTP
jgi:hypothetical protein